MPKMAKKLNLLPVLLFFILDSDIINKKKQSKSIPIH